MKTTLNPVRLLAEVLLIVAIAEGAVMIMLPVLAPNASTANGAMLDVGMVLMLCTPLVYWRLTSAIRGFQKSFAIRQELESASRPVLALVVMTQIMGLLITATSVWWERESLDIVANTRFDLGADRTQAEIVRRLNQSLAGLKGARGAIAANPNFKRNEFRAYVQSRDLPVEFAGIRGFGFIARVQRAALNNFISAERRDGSPAYQVQTKGDFPDLYVVKYIEPLASNAAALGFDLGQESLRRNAVTYAIDTGQPTLLGGIELLQDAKKSPGFIYFLPVYRQGTNPQTVTNRRRDLLGLLYAPIVANELLGSVATVTDNTVDFELFDGTEADANKLIFDADGVLSIPKRGEKATEVRRHITERTFEVGSKILTMRATSSARFEAAQDRSSLIIIGAGGALVSLLIAVTVGLLASGRQRARALAASMTAELDRMAQVVQHTGNAVTIMDRNMRILWVNRGFVDITGYSFDEAKEKTPSELLGSGKSDPASIQALINGAIHGAACRVELINRAKSGREYWADTEVQPMRDKQGALIGFMEIGTDVTAQKEIQRQLEVAIRDSRALLDTVEIHAIVSITDASGVIMQANDAFLEISRYSREELVGSNHNIVNSAVHPLAFWQEFWGTISSGKPWRGEICNKAKDGTLYWVDSMIAPFAGSNGVIEKYISIRTDISARKRAENALSLSNALMEESQSVAKVGGWELNLLTGHLYWTQETYRIHEISPQEFNPTVDAGLHFYLPESRERISKALDAAVKFGAGYDLELETLTTKGQRIDVRTTATATWEGGKVVRLSGIFQDITERKQYERTLQEALDKAEIATRSKAQFLANMSHEIRTPMNAILGLLRLLQKTELNQRQLDYAEKTESAAKSLLGLINDILDFSKIEASKMTLDPQAFCIEEVLRNLSVILSGNLPAKAVQILFDVDVAIPEVLVGDAMRLQQVLVNLGGNAIKFTAEGEVVISVHLVERHDGLATLKFAVRDTGIGIAPENQAHIFTGFSQAEASTTRKFGGTGLGLAISQRFVELMGGTLTLESELGRGSVFSFLLPMQVVTDIPAELVQSARDVPAGKKVLVVDANPVARGLAAAAVQSWGWQVECAASGAEALALMASHAANGTQTDALFDVIFVDSRLCDRDGWKVAANVRQIHTQRHLTQPTIVMIAVSRRDAIDPSAYEGRPLFNGVLVKPVTPGMLLDAALQIDAASPNGAMAQARGTRLRRLQHMHVLVVEDNLLNQQIAEELLASEGAVVSLAANGQLGVDAIAAAIGKRQFDAVLMDIQMPVMDGYAATSQVRNTLHLKDLAIIAMTANAMDSDREDCIAAGMNAHIGKPFDLDNLVQTLLEVSGFQPESDPIHLPQASAGNLQQAPETEIADLNVDAALNRMGGLSTLYVRAARAFIQTLPEQIDAIVNEVESGGVQSAVLAHTLKGISATLGADSLAQVAAQIERLAKKGEFGAQIKQPLERLRKTAGRAGIALAAAADRLEGVGADTKPADLDALNALNTLIRLLENEDLAALEYYARVKSRFDGISQAALDRLEKALQDLDLNAALVVCRGLHAR